MTVTPAMASRIELWPLDRLTPYAPKCPHPLSAARFSDEDIPEAPVTPVSQPGDIWQLGAHRLTCGDSTDPAVVAALMAGDHARLCFTSPPYGQQRDYTQGINDCRESRKPNKIVPCKHAGQDSHLRADGSSTAMRGRDGEVGGWTHAGQLTQEYLLATGQTFDEVEAQRQISSGNAPAETRSDPLSPDRRSGALA